MNQILDDAEDPDETFGYAFESLMQTVGDTHRLKEELSAAKNRLQHQAFNVNGSIGDLQTEALRAVANEKEEIARVALQRRQASLFIVEALHQKIIDLDHQEQNLTSTALQVMEKMEAFETSKKRLQTQSFASSEGITQIRSLVDDIDQPKIPEDFSGKDAVRIIRELAPLSYLDPPFNSNATYNVLFRERRGEEAAAQITAFDDTWRRGLESELAYQEVTTEQAGKVGELLAALRSFLGQNDMMAYLTMMAQRMIELHRVLKTTGSIYLHCDPTASHYLKLG